ncbi:MAG: shikimate kinase [Kiloniellales bacterium]
MASEPSSDLPAVPKSIVLIGLMGAGKSAVGRRLAARLGLPFIDADAEIEKAAGCSIEDIFATHGEAAFRDGERRVIARLIKGPKAVLATGGGAFMAAQTREIIQKHGISVWLRADLDLLLERTSRRAHRPLLKQGNPRQILARLIEERYPVYAQADTVVDSANVPLQVMVDRVAAALYDYLQRAES